MAGWYVFDGLKHCAQKAILIFPSICLAFNIVGDKSGQRVMATEYRAEAAKIAVERSQDANTRTTGKSGMTTAFVPKANNCVKRTSTGGLKNVCSYPIVVAYCTQSPSSFDDCSGSNSVLDGLWINASGGRLKSGESVNLWLGGAPQSSTGISFGACDARQSRLNEGVAVRLRFNGETVSSFTCSL